MSLLTKNQKKILEYFRNKYEDSKTCFGENKVNQTFKCKPDMFFQDYSSDYIDLAIKDEYDWEIADLEKRGLVTTEKKYTDYTLITMVNSKYDEYLRLLGVKSREKVLLEQKSVFEKYLNKSPFLSKICREQLTRLETHKDNSIHSDLRIVELILKCVEFIEHNEQETLERELSIEIFSDSKLFEKSYKAKVCSLIFDCDKSESVYNDDSINKNDALLSKYNIVKNPTYIFFKGKGEIFYNSGYKMELIPDVPVAINSKTIGDIKSISVCDRDIMTVENLTSYNRLQAKDTFMLYLSGYSNSAKCEFLKNIAMSNPDKKWFHFGDLDPDGFLILEDLKARTGIDFRPFRMDLSDLITYKAYTKELTKSDKDRLAKLLNSPYNRTAKYMLDNNCKLEQEIISWKKPRS